MVAIIIVMESESVSVDRSVAIDLGDRCGMPHRGQGAASSARKRSCLKVAQTVV